MFINLKQTINAKIAQREQKRIDETIVIAANKLPAAEINDVMSAIGLKQFATFQ